MSAIPKGLSCPGTCSGSGKGKNYFQIGKTHILHLDQHGTALWSLNGQSTHKVSPPQIQILQNGGAACMTGCSEEDCLRELPGRYWNSLRENQETGLVAPWLRARNKLGKTVLQTSRKIPEWGVQISQVSLLKVTTSLSLGIRAFDITINLTRFLSLKHQKLTQ